MPTFEFWWVLLLLPLAPWPALRRLERPRSRVVIAPSPERQHFDKKPFSYWLWTGCLVSLLIAVAGPRPNPAALGSSGILQVVLDYSGSMEDELPQAAKADDPAGPKTRWDVAAQAVVATMRSLGNLPASRRWEVGLLIFARQPDWVVPSGSTPEALDSALVGLKPVKTPGETSTHIGWALTAGLEPFLSPNSETSGRKAILLVTDGEHNSLPTGEPGDFSPRQAAQLAGELGVQIIPFRVPASKSPEFIQKQANQLLLDLAQRTGGKMWDLPLEEKATKDFLTWLGATPLNLAERIWSLPWRPLLTLLSLFLAAGALWKERCEG